MEIEMYVQKMKMEDLQQAMKYGVGVNEAVRTYKAPKTRS
jgi:hypothetical protein